MSDEINHFLINFGSSIELNFITALIYYFITALIYYFITALIYYFITALIIFLALLIDYFLPSQKSLYLATTLSQALEHICSCFLNLAKVLGVTTSYYSDSTTYYSSI